MNRFSICLFLCLTYGPNPAVGGTHPSAIFATTDQCVDIVLPQADAEKITFARLKQPTPEVESKKRFKIDVWRHFVNASTGQSSRFSLVPSSSGYRLADAGFIKDGRYISGVRNGLSQLAMGFSNWIDPVKTELRSGSQGVDLLERNQFFPLKVMKDQGYISEEEHAAQLSISKKKIDARQVTFIEASEEIKQSELMKRFGEIPPTARMTAASQATRQYLSRFVEYEDNVDYTFENKVGSCWLISGQINGAPAKIAAEDSRLVKPIDRKAHPYIWEIGRAAQTEDHAFEETLRVAVYLALHELIASGGSIDDAYFFGHALNSGRYKVFRRMYGMKSFSNYKGNPEETLLIVPLRDLLVRFGISDLIGGWKARQISEDPTEEVLRMRYELKLWKNQILEAVGEEKHRLSIRDFTDVGLHVVRGSPRFKNLSAAVRPRASQALEKISPLMEWRDRSAHILEETSKKYLSRIFGTRSLRPDDANPGFMKSRFGLMELDEFLTGERRAVEVTVSAKGEAALSLFLSAYENYLDQLSKRGFQTPVEFLRQKGVEFAMTTSDSETASLLLREEHSGEWFVHRDRVIQKDATWFMNYETEVVSQVSLWSTAFSIDQMERLRQGRGTMGRLQLPRLRQSLEQTDQMLSTPELIL